MATVTHSYTPNQTVFVIDPTCGVREGVVLAVIINVKPTGTVINYDIAYTNAANGTTTTAESNVFGDVDSALTAYRAIILA